MLVFISCAKTMAARCSVVVPEVTVPKFETEAVRNALEMSQYSVSELERLLRVNTKIAAENRLRFHDFCSEENRSMPAVCAYTGAVFKRILPKDFSAEDFRYAQEHLRITSFLYGLLRPLDGNQTLSFGRRCPVCPKKVEYPCLNYWKPLLTDFFIEEIRKQGGILVNLASGEMKELFDWKRVEREVRVITPDFQVRKGDGLKPLLSSAKMCRGEWCVSSSRTALNVPKI